MKSRFVSSSGIVVFAFVLVACSGASSTPITGQETSPTEPEAAPAAPPETPAATAPAAPATEADAGKKPGACAGEASKQSCSQCCATKHEDGAATYIGAVMVCMCQGSTCEKACEKTLCDPNTPRDPDATCQACINNKSGACASDIQTACSGDADCMAFDACIADSGCLYK